ncbi:hypothetical protein IPF37_03155 [bacterium]|nr:MAG: hypothetical protein IPF37_03155 [bacterium]
MNKIIVFTILLFSHNALTAKPWSEILLTNSILCNDSALTIIFDQHKYFATGNAPIILRISMLPNHFLNEPFYAPFYNSGLPSASQIRAEVYRRLERLIDYLDEFSIYFGYVPRSISIKILKD